MMFQRDQRLVAAPEYLYIQYYISIYKYKGVDFYSEMFRNVMISIINFKINYDMFLSYKSTNYSPTTLQISSTTQLRGTGYQK